MAAFLCCRAYFYPKKLQKIEKIKKKAEKMRKNLHISEKSITFALDFGKIPETTPKNNPIRNPKI